MDQDGFSKCHPATNFLFFLCAICFGVVFQHPAYLACAMVCAGVYYILLQGRKALKAIALMLPLWVAVAVINPVFNTRGAHVLFLLFGRPYTWEALCYGLALGAILIITLLWFGCYNRVMTEDKFTALFGSLAPSMSLLLVMVLRLIPGLTQKAQQITEARRGIGKAGDRTAFKEKLRHGMTVLLTLAGWALEESIITADSMRSRGYGTARRSSFQLYRMTGSDRIVLAVTAVTAGLTLWGAATGAVQAQYTPALTAAPIDFFLPVYCIFLLIPTFIHAKEVLLCRIFISRI